MKLSFVFRTLILAVALIDAFQSPAQQVTASSETTTDNGRETYRRNTTLGVNNFNIEVRGKIEVSDDDKDIKGLSNDGYVEITKTVFGSKRAIVIESLGGGKLRREYFEGRTKMDWEPNGKNWLAEILPEIVRSTTLGADSRVNRIYSKGGTAALLKEFALLEGDYIKSHYAKLILAKDIPANEMAGVVNALAGSISSDYYLASVFQGSLPKLMATPESANALFEGTKKINSDYYKAGVLKDVLKQHPASPSQVKTALQAAGTINSDYYLSMVLSAVLEEDALKEESLNDLIQTSRKIPSDYYRTQVLSKAIAKPAISKSSQRNIIEALNGVGSDYYKTGVVINMADHGVMEPDVQVQVISMINSSVSSDYYAANALKSIADHQKLTDESFKQLVITGGKINSANYASEVLKNVSSNTLSKPQLIEILKAAGQITSDHYMTEVLMGLADQVRSSDASVKDAYRQTAKKINSESNYGKVMKAID